MKYRLARWIERLAWWLEDFAAWLDEQGAIDEARHQDDAGRRSLIDR